MITAEEFFRNKIKEQNPNREVVTLSQELITAEQGLRWAHEFKQLHLHAVSGSLGFNEGYEKGWTDATSQAINEIQKNYKPNDR